MQQPMQILTSHATTEWYTPPEYIEMAREVLGDIDTDPASSARPQTWIKAKIWYNEQDNGLLYPWFGRVWLNPPYGTSSSGSNQAVWSKRLVHEYLSGNTTAAILLVNSTHGYDWYERLWAQWPVCCVRKRMKFIMADGGVGGEAKRGQTFVYFGMDYRKFHEVFAPIGRVLFP